MGVKADTEHLLNNTLLSANKENVRYIFNNSPIVRKIRHRTILKNGTCNISQPQSKRQQLIFLRFTKLVDASWLWTLFVFLAMMILSWFGFAVIWYLICYTHGDFEPKHLPPLQKQLNFTPCVYHIYTFVSCLQFSMETQHTIGYGIKATTDECPEAIFVNALQCVFGFIMQGFMAVTILAKMTLPRLRSETLLFSKNAVISQRHGKLSVMFRIGDMRKNHIIDATVRAFFVKSYMTPEGQVLNHHQTELKVLADNCITQLPFNWPMVIVHIIDPTSPLYYFCPGDFLHDQFEIMVVLEGTIQSTGQMTQARTSYIATDIMWGMKFASLLNFDNHRREFEADFSKFHELLSVSTPLCSAAYIDKFTNLQYGSKYSSDSSVYLDFRSRHSQGEINVDKLKENIISINSSECECEKLSA